jgi:hypothetical protein
LYALEKAGFDKNNPEHMLISCGDHFDRGRKPVEVMNYLMALPRKILIRGNHEDLLYECCERGWFKSHDESNGTIQTIDDLTAPFVIDHKLKTGDYPNIKERCAKARRILKPFYQSLIDYYETRNYIFVHGWIPYIIETDGFVAKRMYDPDWRDADSDGWRRARWSNGMELSCKYRINEPNKTVVCGHWHASYGHSRFENKGTEWGRDADHTPFYGEGIIAIDGCTAVSQAVNCIVIDDKEK